jgi:type I restriction enzyme, S subunit
MSVIKRKDLPEGWVWKTVGEVCEFKKGKKPKNSGFRSDTRTVPYINIKAFETGKPEEYAELGNYPMCSKDDVLIVWDGARSGLVGSSVSGYIGSTLSKVWSHETDNKYLFYFLKSQYDYINTNTKGVGIPHVDPGIINAIPIPLAPFDQQQLIVAEIEKQFSRLDEAVEAFKRIQANLKRYKASVLKAAVEGKLTEQWRSRRGEPMCSPCVSSGQTHRSAPTKDETGAELLKRILVERKKKWEEDYLKKNVGAQFIAPIDDAWKKKYKEPAPPDTSNLPELPKGWVWVSLGQLIDEPKYGTSKKCGYKTDGIGVLRIPNIVNGFVDNSDLKFAEFDENEIKTYRLQEGDILTIRSNGSVSLVGKCALVSKSDEKYLYAGYLIKIRPLGSVVHSEYLMICLSSLSLRKQIEAKAKSTSGVNNINAGELASLIVPICRKEEQKEIIRIVDEKLSDIEHLWLEVDSILKRSGRLRQSILKKAFSGKLV